MGNFNCKESKTIKAIDKSLESLNRESIETRLERIKEACKAHNWSLIDIISK